MPAAQNPDVGDLQVTTSLAAGSPTIVVAGEIDAHTCARLKAVLDETIAAATEGTELVIDMAGVTFLDSSGLRVLIGAYKDAEDRGGRLRLQAPGDGVVRLLEITGLADRFLA